LLDALPDYIFVKDRTGRFILSNLAHVSQDESCKGVL